MPERPPQRPSGRPSERELQRRWAQGRWPVPFLATGPDGVSGPGGVIRVISPGRWNHGPGPDFRDAQILDADGRARRGDVELHLEPRAWLQHGHAADPAYANLLLHLVERAPASTAPPDPRVPPDTPLPPSDCAPGLSVPTELPCATIVARAGAAAVEARLLAIGRRRFLRKAAALRALPPPDGPGSEADRRAVVAAARALGQPHNAALSEQAARRALQGADSWAAVAPTIGAEGWRRGRGALGSPDGLSLILTTLLQRWTRGGVTPWGEFERLAPLPLREAAGALQIRKRFGRARAVQLLADAVYPLTNAWPQWRRLPGVRYQRTDALRVRLEAEAGFRWRHPHTQALLELEQTRCRAAACRICPLAALAAGDGR